MSLGVMAKVAGIYRYPVQSVRGESVAAATFAAHGIPGDRAYAIADLELGCVAHASRAKKQYRPLITWNARYLAEPREGTAPAVTFDADNVAGNTATLARALNGNAVIIDGY